MKGVLAERMLRRFRYQLIARVLRFPQPYFERVSQGELVSMVTSESEPMGGLMGDAVSQPVLQAGQNADHPVLFVPAKLLVWNGGDCAHSAAGLAHPDAAASDQPSEQEAHQTGARTCDRNRRERGRGLYAADQWRLAVPDGDHHRPAWAAL